MEGNETYNHSKDVRPEGMHPNNASTICTGEKMLTRRCFGMSLMSPGHWQGGGGGTVLLWTQPLP